MHEPKRKSICGSLGILGYSLSARVDFESWARIWSDDSFFAGVGVLSGGLGFELKLLMRARLTL